MRARFIYEKFTEDSDPIHDLGIGGVSFKEIRTELVGPRKDMRSLTRWLDYLQTLIGKTISGYFNFKGSKKYVTFKIYEYRSMNFAQRLIFYDNKNKEYEVIMNNRYVIK